VLVLADDYGNPQFYHDSLNERKIDMLVPKAMPLALDCISLLLLLSCFVFLLLLQREFRKIRRSPDPHIVS